MGVIGLPSDGKSWRFRHTGLQHDIVPEESSFKVTKNHLIVELQKKKTSSESIGNGYEMWTDVGGRKRSEGKDSSAAGGGGGKLDPSSSIMGMMQDLYEEGDDETRKAIGQAMESAHKGGGGKKDPSDSLDTLMEDDM